MIASVWDWPSLKYVYFVISSERLDAGGWSPTRGIVANNNATSGSSEVVSFDDILPDLPKDCYFAGVGDFCVGELFAKRDPEPPQSDALPSAPKRPKVVSRCVWPSSGCLVRSNKTVDGSPDGEHARASTP